MEALQRVDVAARNKHSDQMGGTFTARVNIGVEEPLEEVCKATGRGWRGTARPERGPAAKQEAGSGVSVCVIAWAGDCTVAAWNASVTWQDDVQEGGVTGVVTRDDRVATDKVPRVDEDTGCEAATDVLEWGGGCATLACNIIVRGSDAAPAGCLARMLMMYAGREATDKTGKELSSPG